MSLHDIKQEISVDQYVYVYMTEQRENELVGFVKSTHSNYLDWKKKQKHLQLATDLENDKVIEKKDKSKKKEKDDIKKPIEFPSECIIPINIVYALMTKLRIAFSFYVRFYEERNSRMYSIM